ncbi:MAG: hypothetical protein IJG19_04060 [Methanobrevibacter sp.]|nr:hypothetical protein [Methanobrevibacter sp.]
MFNFNEMFYTGATNAIEQEKLNIGLWLGYYIITAENKSQLFFIILSYSI